MYEKSFAPSTILLVVAIRIMRRNIGAPIACVQLNTSRKQCSKVMKYPDYTISMNFFIYSKVGATVSMDI